MYRGFLLSTYFNQIYDDIDLWNHGIGSHEKRTFLKFYVGIDIAKLNNVASAISSDSEVLIQSFKFTNDGDGFQLLTSKLESFEIDSIIIGLKSTPTLAATSLNILLPITIRFVSLTHPRFTSL